MLKSLKKALTLLAIVCSLCTTSYATELNNWSLGDFINANNEHLIPQSVGVSSMRVEITREQFCDLVVNTYEKVMGKELSAEIENPFEDCDSEAVIKACAAGFINGKKENEFAPDEPVTREVMAKILHNVMVADEMSVKFPIIDVAQLSSYEDISEVSSWAYPSMAAVISSSLIGGVDGKILPKENVTCEQAIVVVNRLYNFFKSDKKKPEFAEEEVRENFVITSFAEGTVFDDVDIPVQWNAVDGAVSYNVLLRNSDGELIINETVSDTTCIITKAVLVAGEYNISVQANFENEDLMYSIPLGFCYAAPVVEEPVFNPSGSDNSLIESIFAEAEKYIGTPYRYGGTTPAGFDCSGYVQYVFKNNGINLKRTSRDQYASNGVSISKSELKRGDLVFFGTNGRVGHVGIYAGDGKMIMLLPCPRP